MGLRCFLTRENLTWLEPLYINRPPTRLGPRLAVSETVTEKSVKGGQFGQADCVLIIFYGQTDVDIELSKLP